MTFMLNPDAWSAYFDNQGGVLLNLSEPTLIPRYLHMVTGALAVTGLAWAVWAWYREKRGGPVAAPRVKEGLRLFWIFTVAEIVLGLVWLMTLPRDVMMLFMGGSMYASILLLLGVLLAIGLVLMAIRGRLWATVATLLLTMVVMMLMRDVVRGGYLSQYFGPGELEVNLVISPLVLFLVTFVVGLGAIYWMIRTALDPRQRVESEGGES